MTNRIPVIRHSFDGEVVFHEQKAQRSVGLHKIWIYIHWRGRTSETALRVTSDINLIGDTYERQQ